MENEYNKEKVETKFISILKHSFNLFKKVYLVRIIYSLFKMFKNRNKIPLSFLNLIVSVFNISNLRTGISVSSIPLVYAMFKKLLGYFGIHKDSTRNIFWAGFLSALISILIEEKTNLVSFILLSIIVRIGHSALSLLCKKLNIFQEDSKTYDYFSFLLMALTMYTVNFLNPGFKPITKQFDAYNNYLNQHEYDEMVQFRENTRIV